MYFLSLNPIDLGTYSLKKLLYLKKKSVDIRSIVSFNFVYRYLKYILKQTISGIEKLCETRILRCVLMKKHESVTKYKAKIESEKYLDTEICLKA